VDVLVGERGRDRIDGGRERIGRGQKRSDVAKDDPGLRIIRDVAHVRLEPMWIHWHPGYRRHGEASRGAEQPEGSGARSPRSGAAPIAGVDRPFSKPGAKSYRRFLPRCWRPRGTTVVRGTAGGR